MCLVLSMNRGFIPYSYNVRACVRNKCQSNVTSVVIELLKPDFTAAYSTEEDTRTWTPGNELCIDFMVPSTVPRGIYYVRASGRDENGNPVTSNILMVYVDDKIETGVKGDYVAGLRYIDAVVDDYGSGDLLAPRSADLFVAEVAGQGYYLSASGELVRALAVSRKFSYEFDGYDTMYDFLKSISFVNPIADETALSNEEKVDALLPFFNYSWMQKTRTDLVCVRDGLKLVCHQLVTVRLRMYESLGGGGGAGGAVIAAAVALGLWNWWLSRQTVEEVTTSVKESAKQVIDNEAEIAKKLSKQIEDTAISIVQSTADTVWSIPKNTLIAKLKSIGSFTRSDITRIANIHKANIDAIEAKPKLSWKDLALVGLGGMVVGLIVGRGRK